MAFRRRRFSRFRRAFRRFTGRRGMATRRRGRYQPSARRIRIGYRM